MTNIIMAALFCAIQAVEGGAPGVRGDGGRAHGPLQIHQAMIDDVNRISRGSFTLADADDPIQAQRVMVLYFRNYARPEHAARDLALMWNAGPDGSTSPRAHDYATRVAAIYNTLASACPGAASARSRVQVGVSPCSASTRRNAP